MVKNTPAASTSSDVTSAIGDKNTAIGGFKERMLWKEEDMIALKEIFSKEIEAKSLTLAVVREKVKGHATLYCLDPRKVYDKVRSEWRFTNNTSCKTSEITDDQPSPALPQESDTLADKLSRFFSNEDSSVSMVPPQIQAT